MNSSAPSNCNNCATECTCEKGMICPVILYLLLSLEMFNQRQAFKMSLEGLLALGVKRTGCPLGTETVSLLCPLCNT